MRHLGSRPRRSFHYFSGESGSRGENGDSCSMARIAMTFRFLVHRIWVDGSHRAERMSHREQSAGSRNGGAGTKRSRRPSLFR
jgi:hypothetical protein